MSVGSRIKGFLWTTVVVVAVAGVGLYFVNSPNGRSEDWDNVEVGALWEPINRDLPLSYQISAGGKTHSRDQVSQSPMTRGLRVRASQTVTFDIAQNSGGVLTCFLTRDGAAVVPQPKGTVTGRGTAICVG